MRRRPPRSISSLNLSAENNVPAHRSIRDRAFLPSFRSGNRYFIGVQIDCKVVKVTVYFLALSVLATACLVSSFSPLLVLGFLDRLSRCREYHTKRATHRVFIQQIRFFLCTLYRVLTRPRFFVTNRIELNKNESVYRAHRMFSIHPPENLFPFQRQAPSPFRTVIIKEQETVVSPVGVSDRKIFCAYPRLGIN